MYVYDSFSISLFFIFVNSYINITSSCILQNFLFKLIFKLASLFSSKQRKRYSVIKKLTWRALWKRTKQVVIFSYIIHAPTLEPVGSGPGPKKFNWSGPLFLCMQRFILSLVFDVLEGSDVQHAACDKACYGQVRLDKTKHTVVGHI